MVVGFQLAALAALIGSLLFPCLDEGWMGMCNSSDHIERLSHHIMMGMDGDGTKQSPASVSLSSLLHSWGREKAGSETTITT